MGYSYTSVNGKCGRLCCDSCGSDEKVRKVKCPYGWCPAPALCPDCRHKHAHELTPAAHAQCKASVERSAALHERERQLLAAGIPVRCSALNAGDNGVHVLFRLADGKTLGYYMEDETYAAIPYYQPATPDDYLKFGELTIAPADFQTA